MRSADVTEQTEFEVFLPFGKVDQQGDGSILVHTRLNDETLDDQGEIVTFEAVEKASGPYLEWSNVREMHNAETAAGTMVSLTPIPDERAHEAILHVVDPIAVQKVLTKVYKGTSLGGVKRRMVLSKVGGENVRKITEIDWRETSLVDRPSRPTATLSLLKRSDLPEGELVIEDQTDLSGEPVEEPIAKAAGSEAEAAAPVAEPEPVIEVAPEAVAGSGDVYIGADPVEKVSQAGDLQKRDIPDSTREDLPAGDFAGKDKSFPIVKPGDVAAAAQAIGRAGPDNYSSDQLKSRIMAIAKRKGPAFEAKLPKSWTDGTEKASQIGDLAKGATWDVTRAASALLCINDLIESEASEGTDETADLGFLRGAQAAILAFIASESQEVGTEEDESEEMVPEVPMAMAYAAVIADLAKRAGTAEAGSLLAKIGTTDVPEPVELIASGEIPDATLAKVSGIIRDALGTLVTKDELAAMTGSLSEIRESLQKVASQPVNGGPLRYATDPVRFGQLVGDPAGVTPPEEALLQKVAATYPMGSIEREALGSAAAKLGIRQVLERG